MNMKSYRRLGAFVYPQISGYFTRNCHHSAEITSTLKYPKPNVPLKTKRGPTDILKALAGTVNQDLTAPAYKYHDDPYLYPILSSEKRSYALSKESGKKAARWVRDTHAEFFNHQPDDPIIEALLPKIKFDENSEVTENDLLNSIKNLQVSEAIQVYNLCQDKSIELTTDTCQALLELLSFSNCQDGIDPDWLEEIAHQPFTSTKIRKTWKDGNLAEELFQELEKHGNLPYCAVIKGMSKFCEVNNAWRLYQEAMTKGLPLDTETFNALIRITPALDSEHALCWEKAEDILRKMVELGIAPNIGTMNALLQCLTALRSWKREARKRACLSILSEFKQFGIQPCLASYYYILTIYAGMECGPVLESILDDIESRTMIVQDPNDTMFPLCAMELCMKNNLGLHLAERMNVFLQKDDNLNFLGENLKMVRYFRYYFLVAVGSMPLPEFITTIYERLVPHVYTPDKEVMEEIVQNIGVHNQLSYLPRIWSDCVMFRRDEEKVMEMILMVINKHTWDKDDPTLISPLGDIAWDIWNRIQEKKTKNIKIEWSDEMMGDCISSLVKSENLEKATTIFSVVCSDPSLVAGVRLETLNLLLDATLQQNLLKDARMVAQYAKENGYPEGDAMMDRVNDMAKP